MIRQSKVGNVILTEQDIAQALTELSGELRLTVAETERKVRPLAGAGDAAGWAAAIAATVQAVRGQSTSAPSTADMIRDYERRFPAYDPNSGARLALTDTGQRPRGTASAGSRPAMSDADAASEISRIALTHNQTGPRRRIRFDMGKVAAAAITPAEPVALSAEREYTDSSELRLTVPATGQADVEAYLTRLASQDKTAKYIDLSRHAPTDTTSVLALAQCRPDRSDLLDSAEQSLSDLMQQAVQDSQSWTGATFSPFAQQEFDALPDEQAQPIQAALDAANQAAGPHQAAAHLLRAMRAACGTKHLKHELSLRAHGAVDAAVSGIPSPADATTQSAGGVNTAAEVQRLSTLASAPARGNTTGNLRG